MVDKCRRALYRLYAMAESCYLMSYDTLKRQGLNPDDTLEDLVVGEEPEDDWGDQWIMGKKDYDLIRNIIKVYENHIDEDPNDADCYGPSLDYKDV